MRISDWSSDVCSSDLIARRPLHFGKVETLVRVEVEDHAVRLLDIGGVAGPAMELDRSHLHAVKQALGAVDIYVLLRLAGFFANGDMLHPVTETATVMLLEKAFLRPSLRPPHQADRPPRKMRTRSGRRRVGKE